MEGPQAAVPQVLCDARALSGKSPAPAGALWKLVETGRRLDADLIQLPPQERIGSHTEPDLDVLLIVAGDGVLGIGITGEPQRLTEGTLL